MNTKDMAKGTNDHLKVVIMGDACVGKTAIVEQFLYERCPLHHKPTIEDMYYRKYDISGTSLTLNILDTSGSYQFTEMKKMAIRTSDAFILVYSIDNMETFNMVSDLRDLILEIRQVEERVPVVVVGNKIDLNSARAVPKDITESIVNIDWNYAFVESSAKENINILQIFKTMLTQAGISFDLEAAVKRRRKSLPVQSTYPKMEHTDEKRPSCVIQ
ncbi:ras-related protein Rap1-like [Stegodyphus dumicola]|uniref:ras-related protein Rap1-like n=1 Tax=Stegodyphus dumicola TaxID=202533 RepID=UPI0015A9B576|nr:ras-related protein Rap1-like [Stegodyphus dumicola]